MMIKQLIKRLLPAVPERGAGGASRLSARFDMPAAVESAVRMALALILALGRVLGSLSPFGAAFAAASGWRLSGAAALAGRSSTRRYHH